MDFEYYILQKTIEGESFPIILGPEITFTAVKERLSRLEESGQNPYDILITKVSIHGTQKTADLLFAEDFGYDPPKKDDAQAGGFRLGHDSLGEGRLG